ncbi:MAG: hypothetical protein COU63_02510 [Candidatus Pacebacteria bacterium CG10_big_fil_rev_8_21_14_0_10_36_11]|nr:cytochrome b5 domain-containing protein [Candidatus Pacearchaeota archaeon]PIR64866.1 MAG: hypothetical protein COU63_02510 [Candidatus Pacebacteria bacterium CG10_big_fil_rev_8_21_14_0_10_36_11]
MKKHTYLILLFLTSLFFSGCSLQKKTNQVDSSQINNQATAQPSITAIKQTGISVNEIIKHNNANDCWLVIDGNVYDVTKYIEVGIHPGGEAILEGCGLLDSTKLFTTQGGRGEGHSTSATQMLKTYLIGEIAN